MLPCNSRTRHSYSEPWTFIRPRKDRVMLPTASGNCFLLRNHKEQMDCYGPDPDSAKSYPSSSRLKLHSRGQGRPLGRLSPYVLSLSSGAEDIATPQSSSAPLSWQAHLKW